MFSFGLNLTSLRSGADIVVPTAFTDDFNRPDENLENSINWTLADGPAGAFKVVNNMCSVTSATASSYLCPDQGSLNHYSQCVLASLNLGSSYPVAVKVTNSDNFVGFRHNSSNWQVHKFVAGVFTLLGEVGTPAPQTGDIMYIQVQGNQVAARLNGLPLLGPFTVDDFPAVTRQGLIGRSVQGSLLDNFEAGAF